MDFWKVEYYIDSLEWSLQHQWSRTPLGSEMKHTQPLQGRSRRRSAARRASQLGVDGESSGKGLPVQSLFWEQWFGEKMFSLPQGGSFTDPEGLGVSAKVQPKLGGTKSLWTQGPLELGNQKNYYLRVGRDQAKSVRQVKATATLECIQHTEDWELSFPCQATRGSLVSPLRIQRMKKCAGFTTVESPSHHRRQRTRYLKPCRA